MTCRCRGSRDCPACEAEAEHRAELRAEQRAAAWSDRDAWDDDPDWRAMRKEAG